MLIQSKDFHHLWRIESVNQIKFSIKKLNTVLLKRSWVEQNCQPKSRPGMDEGWSQVSQTTFIEIWSDASQNKVLECLCFSTSVDFKAFFDKYFVVKCHLRVWKLLMEFNKVSKTGFASKIRTPCAEILAFFWNKVRRG
jgi:hypothetical protein